MVDPDIILAKTNRIQRCLKRIQETVGDDLDRLEQFDVQDIVTLNLQRATQLVIDLASYVVGEEKWGLPQTFRESFTLLQQNGVISEQLAELMGKMVGFRNIAVHDYETINSQVLRSIVRTHLKDLEDFYSVLIRKYSS